MSELPAEPASRRDRARADTVREIKQTARRVLVANGVEGLALRAVAREMGMTAPAIYRYFASLEDLVEHVVGDLYAELCDELELARDAARPATPGVQLMAGQPSVPAPGRVGSPRRVRPLVRQPGGGRRDAPRSRRRTGRPGRVPAGSGRPSASSSRSSISSAASRSRPTTSRFGAAGAAAAWCDDVARSPLPLGVMHVFLSCWIRLYGTVCMEAFGHLRFAVDDAEPLFEAELQGRWAGCSGSPGTTARRRGSDERHC